MAEPPYIPSMDDQLRILRELYERRINSVQSCLRETLGSLEHDPVLSVLSSNPSTVPQHCNSVVESALAHERERAITELQEKFSRSESERIRGVDRLREFQESLVGERAAREGLQREIAHAKEVTCSAEARIEDLHVRLLKEENLRIRSEEAYRGLVSHGKALSEQLARAVEEAERARGEAAIATQQAESYRNSLNHREVELQSLRSEKKELEVSISEALSRVGECEEETSNLRREASSLGARIMCATRAAALAEARSDCLIKSEANARKTLADALQVRESLEKELSASKSATAAVLQDATEYAQSLAAAREEAIRTVGELNNLKEALGRARLGEEEALGAEKKRHVEEMAALVATIAARNSTLRESVMKQFGEALEEAGASAVASRAEVEELREQLQGSSKMSAELGVLVETLRGSHAEILRDLEEKKQDLALLVESEANLSRERDEALSCASRLRAQSIILEEDLSKADARLSSFLENSRKEKQELEAECLQLREQICLLTTRSQESERAWSVSLKEKEASFEVEATKVRKRNAELETALIEAQAVAEASSKAAKQEYDDLAREKINMEVASLAFLQSTKESLIMEFEQEKERLSQKAEAMRVAADFSAAREARLADESMETKESLRVALEEMSNQGTVLAATKVAHDDALNELQMQLHATLARCEKDWEARWVEREREWESTLAQTRTALCGEADRAIQEGGRERRRADAIEAACRSRMEDFERERANETQRYHGCLAELDEMRKERDSALEASREASQALELGTLVLRTEKGNSLELDSLVRKEREKYAGLERTLLEEMSKSEQLVLTLKERDEAVKELEDILANGEKTLGAQLQQERDSWKEEVCVLSSKCTELESLMEGEEAKITLLEEEVEGLHGENAELNTMVVGLEAANAALIERLTLEDAANESLGIQLKAMKEETSHARAEEARVREQLEAFWVEAEGANAAGESRLVSLREAVALAEGRAEASMAKVVALRAAVLELGQGADAAIEEAERGRAAAEEKAERREERERALKGRCEELAGALELVLGALGRAVPELVQEGSKAGGGSEISAGLLNGGGSVAGGGLSCLKPGEAIALRALLNANSSSAVSKGDTPLMAQDEGTASGSPLKPKVSLTNKQLSCTQKEKEELSSDTSQSPRRSSSVKVIAAKERVRPSPLSPFSARAMELAREKEHGF